MPEAGRLLGPLRSLLLKLGLLAVAAVLALWIGWPSEEQASIEPVETDRLELQPPQAGRVRRTFVHRNESRRDRRTPQSSI
jgi:hypothetical protein